MDAGGMAAGEVDDSGDGAVWEELAAPEGWKKKVKVAQRRGGAARRGDITFVAPNGEEIKNKRQLEKYLKANAGGPALANFDWGTGETPRRSERLSSRKRPSDAAADQEPSSPTTPKRGRKKSGTKPSGEDAKPEEHNNNNKADNKEPQDEQDKDKKAAAEGGEGQEEGGKLESEVNKVAPISCAKTETLGKSQEAQPAQIGVSS